MTHAPRFLCMVFCLVFLAACGPKGTDITRFGLPDEVICEDLGFLPQDLSVYAERAGKDTRLLDPEEQGRQDERFNANFFAAWDAGVSYLSKDHVFEAVTALDPAKGFAENLRPYPEDRWRDIVRNCSMESYGGVPVNRAITVENADLRRLPTDAPYFLNPGKAGEGFPFDYLQNSTLWAGTPVAVIHVSWDRQWVYIQTRLVSGWIKASSVAAVDGAFIRSWKANSLGVIVGDNVGLQVTDQKQDAITGVAKTLTVGTGAIFPFTEAKFVRGAKSPHVYIRVPVRGADGRAEIATALSPIYATRKKPIPLTPGNIAHVGNAMLGEPYGWGGLFGNRDCSAAMCDLFAPFGIWLPRNSRPQGQTGTRLDLAGLTPDQKEERVIRDGVPFFSLVSMPGHVGLYLGSYPRTDGKGVSTDVPVMFHNLWGLRVVTGRGEEKQDGRGVIGKAVVTTLRPGAEHPSISTPASLLDRINGLAILPGKID